MRFDQGHGTATPMRLEHATPWSLVMHSTTEPLRSPFDCDTSKTDSLGMCFKVFCCRFTFLKLRSNLIPNALKNEFFEKMIF